MLMAEWRQDFVRTLFGPLGGLELGDAERAFAELRATGEAALVRDRFTLAEGRFAFAADLRYRGQEHTIPILVERPADLATDTAAALDRFNAQHDRRYGHAAPDQSVEMINLRLVVTVPRHDDAIGRWLAQPWEPSEVVAEQRRKVVFDDGAKPVVARVLWRPALAAGTTIVGPAVIEEANSTTLVHPDDLAVIDRLGNIVITLAERS
jgi:N-methylhydantoinase A